MHLGQIPLYRYLGGRHSTGELWPGARPFCHLEVAHVKITVFVWKHKSKYLTSEVPPTKEEVAAVEPLSLSRIAHFDPDRSVLPRAARLVAVHCDGRVLEFTYNALKPKEIHAETDEDHDRTVHSHHRARSGNKDG